MNTVEKLKLLSSASKWDLCSSSASKRRVSGNNRVGAPAPAGVCKAFGPDGRCISLLKVLYTNSCIHDCKYCPNSTSCPNSRKAEFEPEELAKLFMNYYVRNYVEGLFLSSGVGGDSDKSVERIIDCARLIRRKYKFAGYMHLKVLPGVSREHVNQLSELADRVSINVEAPSKVRMHELSSTKDYNIDIERRLGWLGEKTRSGQIVSGHTTQFVLGANGESDYEYLKKMKWLYNDHALKRAYFSAFDPVPKTPLEKSAKVPLLREHRLYQADWLLRIYKFGFNEVTSVLDDNGFLPIGVDPKEAFARANPERFPVDVNRSSLDELLRVPGIGPVSAKRIVGLQRRRKRIKKTEELSRMGVVVKRAAPFIEVEGARQLSLGAFC